MTVVIGINYIWLVFLSINLYFSVSSSVVAQGKFWTVALLA